MGRILIYDTTLRDGAQATGVSFSTAGKMSLIRRLDELGVDYIEAGYAGSTARDLDLFRQCGATRLSRSRVVAFGSTRRPMSRTAEDHGVVKLLEAGTAAVAIVGKAWKLHVSEVLCTTERENLAMIADTVRFFKDRDKEVLFDAEHFYDGYKNSSSMAMKALKAAVDGGCDTVVLCDTNGGCLPHEVHAITREVVKAVGVPVAVHAHDDGGMAVANSIEAVRAGASQVQGTFNGYGERCGNANLCSVIPTLELKMGLRCVREGGLKELRGVSQFVDDLADLRYNDRLPYVGRSAFCHKAGMHADGVKKNPRSFEHVAPESVGNDRSVVLSEGSGKSSVLLKAIELGVGGIRKSSAELREVVAALKDLESRGYAFEAADASFRMLVQKVLKKHRPFFDLEGFRVIVEKRGKDEPCLSEATIKVRVNDQVEHTVGEGSGPVDALNQALRRALTRFYPQIAKVLLKDFRVRILDPEEATAAKTRVIIESSDGHETWATVGVSQNIIEASWEALVDGVEYKLFRDEGQKSRRR